MADPHQLAAVIRYTLLAASTVLGLMTAGCAAPRGSPRWADTVGPSRPRPTPAPSRSPSSPIAYTVRLDQPQTQTVEIEMIVPDVDGPTLDVALPVWRPGRYQVLDPAGSIRAVAAASLSGQTLPIEKIDKSTWRVSTNGATTVRVHSLIYANSLGDRTRHVDASHAFLSGSAVFFYVPGQEHARPCTVRIEAPRGERPWRTATGLEPVAAQRDSADPDSFVAPNYDVLVDSPFEIGLHERLDFDVDGTPHEIVIWGRGRHKPDRLTRDFAAIVRAARDIFGSLPYRRYVFMIHLSDAGGGTEHLNSTIMQTRPGVFDDERSYEDFLQLVSHEFFHTWNVKQFRPVGLKPYDYARENYTDLLWLAEGGTSYYEDVLLVRAGLMKVDRFHEMIAGRIETEAARPGAAYQSLAESSFDAWIKFNKPNLDAANATVNFYSRGAYLSLLLDLEIRRVSGGRASLDTVLRSLFEKFPNAGAGYSTLDLIAVIEQQALAQPPGHAAAHPHNPDHFKEWFRDHIHGRALPDADALLRTVGLHAAHEPPPTQKAEPHAETPAADRPYLGITLNDKAGKTVVSGVPIDGPAYLAGINTGDEIVALDGRRLMASELDARLDASRAGQEVRVEYFRRDELHTVSVTLASRPARRTRVIALPDPSDAQRAQHQSWLGVPLPAPAH
ncbi:MAG: M61 family metallopeptidase [Phycisphaerae bacterium]|nr:M61 family metallopeptidase [Phycisphaerae bacterium]